MNLNLNLKVNLNPNLNLNSTSEKYICYNQVVSVVRLNQDFKKGRKSLSNFDKGIQVAGG